MNNLVVCLKYAYSTMIASNINFMDHISMLYNSMLTKNFRLNSPMEHEKFCLTLCFF